MARYLSRPLVKYQFQALLKTRYTGSRFFMSRQFKDLSFLSFERFIDMVPGDVQTPHKKRINKDIPDDLADPTLDKRFEPRQVDGFYTLTIPRGIDNPFLVMVSKSGCNKLQFNQASFSDPTQLAFIAGCKVPVKCLPYAHNYGGHQYGVYTPQLGGGRAVCLGETLVQSQRWEIQLKGTGPNCYSRGGDGKCSLGSCVVEFLLSEYCHYVNIPCIQGLAVVGGAPTLIRQGNKERSGVLTRCAPSWIRFGTFELFHYREQPYTRHLANYLIEYHFPEAKTPQSISTTALLSPHLFKRDQNAIDLGQLEPQSTMSSEVVQIPLNPFAVLFRLIIQKTAILVAHWQAQGFVHGLLNTDHMSVLGLTIPSDKSVIKINLGVYGVL